MKVYNVLPHNSYHLLYIQAMSGSSLKTKCCFTTYDMVLPFSNKKGTDLLFGATSTFIFATGKVSETFVGD